MAILRVLAEPDVRSAFGHPIPPNPDPTLFPTTEPLAVDSAWARKSLVRVEVPQLARVRTGAITVHAKIAKPLLAAFTAIADAGLQGLIKSWGGSYVPRYTRGGTTTLSRHTWGIAFDLNVAWNGYNRAPAPFGQPGSVLPLVPHFNAAGFAWGGHFRNHPDGMHFEFADLTKIATAPALTALYRLVFRGRVMRSLPISRDDAGVLVAPAAALAAILRSADEEGWGVIPVLERDTLMPIRAFASALGFTVTWHPEGAGGYVAIT